MGVGSGVGVGFGVGVFAGVNDGVGGALWVISGALEELFAVLSAVSAGVCSSEFEPLPDGLGLSAALAVDPVWACPLLPGERVASVCRAQPQSIARTINNIKSLVIYFFIYIVTAIYGRALLRLS